MRDTIKKHEHFIMPDDAPMARSQLFTIHMCETRFPGDARFGVVATKRTFHYAVLRNRARRMLRDWVRYHEKMMRPDMDYVFVARNGILAASRTQGRDAMRKALRFLSRQADKITPYAKKK